MNKEEKIMVWSYWKAVIHYGHVGHRNEISVARHLVTPEEATTVDVMSLINEMPGTKKRAMVSIKKIDSLEYLEGLRMEREDFFLQRLFERKEAR